MQTGLGPYENERVSQSRSAVALRDYEINDKLRFRRGPELMNAKFSLCLSLSLETHLNL